MEAAEWREWHKTSDGVEICAPSSSELSLFLAVPRSLALSPSLSLSLSLSFSIYSILTYCLPPPFSSAVWAIGFAGIAWRARTQCMPLQFSAAKKSQPKVVLFLRRRFAITSGFPFDALPDWHFRSSNVCDRQNDFSAKLRRNSRLILALIFSRFIQN